MFPSRIVSVLGKGALENNYSLDFDGSDDYVDCGTGIGTALGDSYDGGLTVSAWFKTDIADVDGGIVCFEDEELAIKIGHEGAGSLNLKTHGAGSSFINFTDTSSWHHAVATWDGSANEKKIYLDGGLEDTTSDSNPLDLDGKFLLIGSTAKSSGYEFTGNIDEVAIWNTALSAGDISALYSAKGTADLNDDGNSANLQGWWRMGDGRLDDRNGLIGDQSNTGTAQMFTNPDFTDNISTWDSATTACSVAYSSGSLRQTSSGAADSKFAPSSSGFSDTTGAVRIEAKCTIISGTQTPKLRWVDGGNTNFFTNTGTTVGAVTTFDFYTDGVLGEASFTPQLIGENAGVADWDYIKITEYDGNPGLMTNMASDDIVKDTP